MVDLYKLKVGDYVTFRCGGFAKVSGIVEEISQGSMSDTDYYSHSISFEGYEDSDEYSPEGGYYAHGDDKALTDIMDIVPAEVIERKLKEQDNHTDP
jgi:hypothetical protein